MVIPKLLMTLSKAILNKKQDRASPWLTYFPAKQNYVKGVPGLDKYPANSVVHRARLSQTGTRGTHLSGLHLKVLPHAIGIKCRTRTLITVLTIPLACLSNFFNFY